MISQDEHDKLQTLATGAANAILEHGADSVVVLIATTWTDGKARSFVVHRGGYFGVLGLLASCHRQHLECGEPE